MEHLLSTIININGINHMNFISWLFSIVVGYVLVFLTITSHWLLIGMNLARDHKNGRESSGVLTGTGQAPARAMFTAVTVQQFPAICYQAPLAIHQAFSTITESLQESVCIVLDSYQSPLTIWPSSSVIVNCH